MNYWMKLRGALDGYQGVVQDLQELCAQPRALLLVPDECIFDIRGGRRADNDLH
jgi:hypothetical protein